MMSSLRQWLLECDERRYLGPRSVLNELDTRAETEEIPEEDIPLWCGVSGSCLRQMDRHDEAEEILLIGLERAGQNHVAAGELHQRLSMVWWNRSKFERALEESAMATARYNDGGEQVGLAKCLVDRGIFLGSAGQFEWSTELFEESLARLPETLPRSRAAALHGICHNNIQTGNFHLATNKKLLLEAESLCVDAFHGAKNLWTGGCFFSELRAWGDAIPRLERAAAQLRRLSPVNGALATIDLAQTLIKADQPRLANQRAIEVAEILGAFRGIKAAEAAAMGLVTAAMEARLTSTILSTARKEISRARGLI